MSDLVKAFVLGVVEGLTEFIPVSSTGHLILFGDVLQFHGAKAATFEIFIQLGAIMAVVVLYWPRFRALLDFTAQAGSADFKGLDGLSKLFVACLPAFVLGYLAHDYIKEQLFSVLPVSIALLFGGVVMILVERRTREAHVQALEQISLLQCLGIGIFQCLALWPGVSRSGSTIVGGLLLGLERKVAAEFSFLLAVPVMFAATLYDLWKNSSVLGYEDVSVFAVGFLVSFVVAVFAIKFFLRMLERFTLAPFGYYRVVVGGLVLVLLGWSG